MLSLESERVFQNLLLFCFAIEQIPNDWALFKGNKIHCPPQDQSVFLETIAVVTAII